MHKLMSKIGMSSHPSLGLYVLFSWLHMLTVTWGYFHAGNPEAGNNLLTMFHLLAWGSYSLVYLVPGLIPLFLAERFFPHKRLLVGLLAVIGTSTCILFIHSDSVIYDLYNFHFNSFVINLLTTPGGVESLGGGTDTYFSIAQTTLGHVLAQSFLWLMSAMMWIKRHAFMRWSAALVILFSVMAGERVIYGISDIRNDGTILDTAKVYPFYVRTKFRSLALKFGIKPARRTEGVEVAVDNSRINYPTTPVSFRPVEHPPNVVILVAESLRWDRLTPDIMPNTWALSQKAQNFTRHYSSGNGTREGLFGLFYGLYGSYWSKFMYARQSPLLMDRFQDLGYQFDLRTSARFSYPEFNKTLFAKIPLELQHEANWDKHPWQRDEENATELVEFLKKRDHGRPFMSFFFFESTHARYDFPDSDIIARPYLENLDYASMSRESLKPQISQLLNRYTNAAHWVDKQMGRIYQALEQQGLLENTVVIVTGDHGEEFMERGFWGHNSSFVEQQIHTPMVMWVPGMEHREFHDISSHLDISTTLLQILGAPEDASSYSLGSNLFRIDTRPYTVSSDWHSIGVISNDMKYRISYHNRGADHWLPTRPDDTPFSSDEASGMLQKKQAMLMDAVRNCSRFTRKEAK